MYYGVNGDGRGFVDAMSGFGVKFPLRRKIVTEDFYFDKAVEIKAALEEEFQEDDRKIYEIVEKKSLEENAKEGISIPGCRKARMISIFPDGTYQLKKDVCDCEFCLYGRFNECCASEEEVAF